MCAHASLAIISRAQNFKAAIDKFTEHTSLKRIGDPNDIAEIALALIKSNYINGEIVVVDGGYILLSDFNVTSHNNSDLSWAQ